MIELVEGLSIIHLVKSEIEEAKKAGCELILSSDEQIER